MRRARIGGFALVLLALLTNAGAGRAQGVPPDSLLDAYVRGLSDSTEAWFGITAAPVDTAGLDSALAVGLSTLPGARRAGGGDARGLRFGWSPAPGFNRADGAQLGVGLSLRSPLPGRLTGRAQYTTGSKDALGEAAWSESWRVHSLRSRLALRMAAGRWTETADRDHFDPVFASISAVLWGGDRHQYLRRDGVRASLRLGDDRTAATIGWRDQLESSLPYTTRWTAFGGPPELERNDVVLEGRVRELALIADLPVPGTRFGLQAAHWTSDTRLGSDRQYRRTRLLVAGDVSLGRRFALVPQAGYGRLRGEILPQQAFYFGGSPDIRTLERNEWSGAGRTFARADLVLVDDLRMLLRLPLPAWLPLQASVFAATGASWGRDPVTGVAQPTSRDWPHRSEWLSEAGGGLSWRPGIPDPLSALRFEYAVPLGADGRDAAFTIAFKHPLGLLRQR